jgi:hypothetical protein
MSLAYDGSWIQYKEGKKEGREGGRKGGAEGGRDGEKEGKYNTEMTKSLVWFKQQKKQPENLKINKLT